VLLATLASATRCKPFSDDDVIVWYGFLKGYDDEILAEAIDRFCRGDDPFPAVGKLITICTQILKFRREVATSLRLGRRTGTVEPIPYPGTQAAEMLASASSLPDNIMEGRTDA